MTTRHSTPRRDGTSPRHPAGARGRARGRRRLGRAVAGAALLAICAAPTLATPVGAEAVRTVPAPLPADAVTARAVPGEVVVGFRPGIGSRRRAEVARGVDARIALTLPAQAAALLQVDAGVSPAAALAELKRDPSVAWAEPNRYRQPTAVPNDPLFSQLWSLQNQGQSVNGVAGLAGADIEAVAAWDLAPAGASPLVAVVDTGIALDHPDLAAGIATNPGEQGGGREANGRDDDGNGFVDDWRGWDFADGDNDPSDADGHGTHVAGTIGARSGDGVGVVGVAGSARLLPLRVVGASGATDVDIAAAFEYAGRRGARVVNASLGGPGTSRVIDQAILAFPQTLFVFPAGNTSGDNDAVPDYPCASPAPNALCVAATDQFDDLARFSGFGATSVDLAAPGTNVLGTYPGVDAYRVANGTSVATPHVAGAAALLLQAAPAASVAVMRNVLLAGVEPVPALAGRTVTGGRLNARRSMQLLLGLPVTARSTSATGWDGDPPVIDPAAGDGPDGSIRPLRRATGDRTAPSLRKLRLVRASRNRPAVAFRLAESARVSVSVSRRPPVARRGTPLRTLRRLPPRNLRAGNRGVALGKLPRGRYRIVVRAADPAGNAARVARWFSVA